MAIDMIKVATVMRASKDDPEKAKKLMSNPRQYLEGQGLDIPNDFEVKYVPGSRGCGCYTGGLPVAGCVDVGKPG